MVNFKVNIDKLWRRHIPSIAVKEQHAQTFGACKNSTTLLLNLNRDLD